MPIYMDRHTMPEATTQDEIAKAHFQDLKLQDKYKIKLLTYWFDEERSTAFCLINSPNEESIHRLHDEAHGSIPNEIIEVDPMTVDAFLGRIKDPVPTQGESAIDSAFRIIMFTDLKDSTTMTTRFGDTKAMQFLRIHNKLTRSSLRENNGREVKHTGDGFMISFTSVSNAIDCAIEIQNAFASYNQEHPDEPMHLRIGLSAGEPVEEDGDLFGSTVQLAARICNHAEPDNILADQLVYNLCEPKNYNFIDLGEITPKGFNQAVRIYEANWNKP